MHIQHITFMVRDVQKSVEFYEAVAGLTAVRRYTEGDAELAFLSNGEGATEIELVQSSAPQKYEGKGWFVCFVTDKLGEMHQKIQQMGLNPSDIRNPNPNTRYFYVYDPDGVSVQLKEKK